jgi:anti-anti-sigma regulatory factor
MSNNKPPDLLEISEVRGVTVVRFTRRTILEPDLIDAIGERLLALVREKPGRMLALDFARVETLPSAMLGKLVTLHTAVGEGGGRLAFCGVDPFLQQIFRVCNLPHDIPIHPSEADAVQALVPA